MVIPKEKYIYIFLDMLMIGLSFFFFFFFEGGGGRSQNTYSPPDRHEVVTVSAHSKINLSFKKKERKIS